MTKPRRGVRFPTRNGHSDGRRSSFSEISEDGSGSPIKIKNSPQLDGISEVRYSIFKITCCYFVWS